MVPLCMNRAIKETREKGIYFYEELWLAALKRVLASILTSAVNILLAVNQYVPSIFGRCETEMI